MKVCRSLIVIILSFMGVAQLHAQTERAYLVSIMVQNTVLEQMCSLPLPDRIKSRYWRAADGAQIVQYNNGLKLALLSDDRVLKVAPDESVKQLYRFADDGQTYIEQYRKSGKHYYCTAFVQNPLGQVDVVDTYRVKEQDFINLSAD